MTSTLLAVTSMALVSCAAVPRDTDTVTLSGKVIGRNEVAAAPKWSVNEGYTRAMPGVVGVLISQMRGTPKHFVYRVSSGEGDDWSIHAKADFSTGTCLDIVVPRVNAEKGSFQLDEVELKAASCKLSSYSARTICVCVFYLAACITIHSIRTPFARRLNSFVNAHSS